jgi:hypothetical protein
MKGIRDSGLGVSLRILLNPNPKTLTPIKEGFIEETDESF